MYQVQNWYYVYIDYICNIWSYIYDINICYRHGPHSPKDNCAARKFQHTFSVIGRQPQVSATSLDMTPLKDGGSMMVTKNDT